MMMQLQRLLAILEACFFLWRQRKSARFPVFLRQTFEHLGASFIKLGQTMALRPDFLPIHICQELEKCLDSMPSVPVAEIERVVERELGKPIRTLFRKFSRTPIGCASIAQVHTAVLPSGEKVAVKVMKPGVERLMGTDLGFLRIIAFLADTLRLVPTVPVRQMVREYERFTEEELDFRTEVRYLKLMAGQKEIDIRCPAVHQEHCSRRVITLEWLEGTSLSKLIEMSREGRLDRWLADRGLDRKELVSDVVNACLEQPFLSGFFHGDPHPSNILVADDGSLQWIDFGICGYIDESLRAHNFHFTVSATNSDAAGCVFFMEKICSQGRIQPWYDRNKYRAEVSRILDEAKRKRVRDFSQGQLLQRLTRTSVEAGLSVPTSFMLLTRTTLSIDGIIQNLYPDWVWADNLEKLFRKVFRHQTRRNFRRNKMLYEIDRAAESMSQFPELLDNVLRAKGEKRKETQASQFLDA